MAEQQSDAENFRLSALRSSKRRVVPVSAPSRSLSRFEDAWPEGPLGGTTPSHGAGRAPGRRGPSRARAVRGCGSGVAAATRPTAACRHVSGSASSTEPTNDTGMRRDRSVAPGGLPGGSGGCVAALSSTSYTSRVADGDTVLARRTARSGDRPLSRSWCPSRRVPARTLGASRTRSGESPRRADRPTPGPCSRHSFAPRLSPGPPSRASVSPSPARSRSSPRGRGRTPWHAPSTPAAGCVSGPSCRAFRSPASGRCSSVLARSIRRRAARW